jgi:hypothetical protein
MSKASIWDEYPSDYRQQEMAGLCAAVEAGSCAAVIGLSGSGKSNLLGFFAARAVTPVRRILLDANRQSSPGSEGFCTLALRAFGVDAAPSFQNLEEAVAGQIEPSPAGVCLVIDRFDACDFGLHSPLRALRDAFKYRLTYVIGVRDPLDPASELAELFNGHMVYLGPLAPSDAIWSANSFARRNRQDWSTAQIDTLVEFSGGYPSFLRAACEAAAAGCPIIPAELTIHPIVQRRLAEFHESRPSTDLLRLCGLEGLPLLEKTTGEVSLTAHEQRLYAYLISHMGQVCAKDELVQTVWSEDRIYNQGLRDDSLAQLVRRLREKVEDDPSRPVKIVTVPGRGYLYKNE